MTTSLWTLFSLNREGSQMWLFSANSFPASRWQRLGKKDWSRLGDQASNVLAHRVDRVLGFFYRLPNWDSLTSRRVCSSSFWFRGGGGGPNSNEGTDTVVLYRKILLCGPAGSPCSGRLQYSRRYQSGSFSACSIQIMSHVTYFPAKIQPSPEVSDTCCL